MKLGSDIKLVWIAGMPRAGSMWLFNVTRALVEDAGYVYLPETVPKSEEKMLAVAKIAFFDRNERNVWVLKIHATLKPDIPKSRIIIPRRDPRDALVSFMRFMKCDFENALLTVADYVRQYAYYAEFPAVTTRFVNYSDILGSPRLVARQVADYIGATVSPESIDMIVDRFSKNKVADLIRHREKDVERREREGHEILPDEIVTLGGTNQRVLDLATGFQTGHVSDYVEGGWRRILSDDQQQKMADVLGDACAEWDAPAPPPKMYGSPLAG